MSIRGICNSGSQHDAAAVARTAHGAPEARALPPQPVRRRNRGRVNHLHHSSPHFHSTANTSPAANTSPPLIPAPGVKITDRPTVRGGGSELARALIETSDGHCTHQPERNRAVQQNRIELAMMRISELAARVGERVRAWRESTREQDAERLVDDAQSNMVGIETADIPQDVSELDASMPEGLPITVDDVPDLTAFPLLLTDANAPLRDDRRTGGIASGNVIPIAGQGPTGNGALERLVAVRRQGRKLRTWPLTCAVVLVPLTLLLVVWLVEQPISG